MSQESYEHVLHLSSQRETFLKDFKNRIHDEIMKSDGEDNEKKYKQKSTFHSHKGDCRNLLKMVEDKAIKKVETANTDLQNYLKSEDKIRMENKRLKAEFLELKKQLITQEQQLQHLNKEEERIRTSQHRSDDKTSKKKTVVRAQKLLTGAFLSLDEYATGYIQQNGKKIPFSFPESLSSNEVNEEIWKLYDSYNIS